MGSQQIILILLSVVIIATATASGFAIYKQNLQNSNRQAIISDLQKMAAHAMAYYRSPIEIGGGQGSWVPKVNGNYQGNRCGLWLNYAGYEEHNSGDTFITENGTFKMWIDSYTDDVLKIEATGLELGSDGMSPVKARIDLVGSTNVFTTTILN